MGSPKYFSTWKDGESGSVWNQGETKWCRDKTWHCIFYFLWYHCRQTSFRTIETFSPDKLFVFGKTQGSADAPAPFLGQWVPSEAPALPTEVCYRVLEKVYRAQGRQRAQAACARRWLLIPSWAFESYVFLTNSLSHPVPSEGEKADLEHMHQGRECCNSSKLSNPPYGGRCWIVFIFVGFRSPSSMKV